MCSPGKLHRNSQSRDVTFGGGDGGSLQDAVVIHGAANSLVGIRAEYRYLASRFGSRGTDWELDHQAMRQAPEGRSFDVMTITLEDGTQQTVFFDITEFFAKS